MSAPVLEAQDLKRHYQVGGGLFKKEQTLKALDGASLELHSGKTLAVVGESGCGKSTLARVVTMIEEPSAGTLKIDGTPVRMGDPELRQKIQIVFQNPYGSLNPRHKIGQILCEPLKLNTNMPGDAQRAKAEETMARVGLRPLRAQADPRARDDGALHG